MEANLEFEYTGGGGMAAGYCRKCAIALSIEISPSVLITRWDVLAAERSVVLDSRRKFQTFIHSLGLPIAIWSSMFSTQRTMRWS